LNSNNSTTGTPTTGRNIGIKDVAAAAGVSVTTVSHVLNEVASARISPATRDRVRSVAGELGYGPNSVARALRTSRTALLGLVIEDAGDNTRAGQIILGADRTARARGYNLLVINTATSAPPEAREADVGSLLARGVDGILYAPRHPRQLPALNLGPIPVVLVTAADGSSTAAEGSEYDDGARAAVDCLRAAGHTRIEVIDGTDDQERGGYAAARRLLEREGRPTGVVCRSEAAAMGAYRAAADLGLAIPKDLSVVALADQELIAANLYPALTTVTVSSAGAAGLAGAAARAAGILIDAIGKATGGSPANLPAGLPDGPAYELTVRGSVGEPYQAATPRGNF
jgi:LacI family transcriptional regulator